VATRDWEAGEQVTCCQGAIAELNSEEDAKLKKEGRDFSVMVSTRKKCTCLFLGPARFMNVGQYITPHIDFCVYLSISSLFIA
jgi:hypothetical protein